LAERTAEIIRERRPFGIYHVTNSGSCTWFAFAEEILRLAKNAGLLENIPELRSVPASKFARPAKRPVYSVLRNTKLSSMRSWQEALKEYLGKYAGHYY
jgi:dTDP-4-dehydrorhamnose reductase